MEIITPPVGWLVQYFECGNRQVPPVAAVVTEASPDGMVKLALFTSVSGEYVTTGQYVRHIDDPWVAEHPDVMRRSYPGKRQGAWDWVPGSIYDPVDAAAQIHRRRRRSEGLERVAVMLADGVEEEKIRAAVRSFNLKDDETQAEIDRLKSLATTP